MRWAILTDLFVRSAILLVAGESLRRLFKISHAAQRHRILLWTFASVGFLPLLSAWVPGIHIPVWPRSGEATVSVQSVILGVSKAKHGQYQAFDWPLLVWLCGAIAFFSIAIVGRLVLVRLNRRAWPVTDPGWLAMTEGLAVASGLRKVPLILQLDAPIMPLTFGFLRPRILLPASCMDWSESRKRMVLLHEMAHIRRRDLASVLFANLIAALWWFQPLVWIGRRDLRRESEKACDADVIATGIQPSEYAAELISVAREFNWNRFRPMAAIPMACPRSLESRVLHILEWQPRAKTRTRFLSAVALLAAVAITASAVTLSSDNRLRFSGGSPMKKTLISGLLASIGLSAASITGSVSEATGVTIPDAKVTIYNPDNSFKQETISAADGKFGFNNLPAGQYIVRIDKAGFTSILREFTLGVDSNVQRNLVLMAGANQQNVPVEPGSGAATNKAELLAPGKMRVGGQVMQANLVRKVQPVYPPDAKAAGVQGTVLLDVAVSKEGVPEEMTVLQSPSDDLSEASLQAVREWRYRPTLLNGQPIEVVTQVIINFTLSQ